LHEIRFTIYASQVLRVLLADFFSSLLVEEGKRL
jgi:hypothetical protein